MLDTEWPGGVTRQERFIGPFVFLRGDRGKGECEMINDFGPVANKRGGKRRHKKGKK